MCLFKYDYNCPKHNSKMFVDMFQDPPPKFVLHLEILPESE